LKSRAAISTQQKGKSPVKQHERTNGELVSANTRGASSPKISEHHKKTPEVKEWFFKWRLTNQHVRSGGD
jgi:hypothetical protein